MIFASNNAGKLKEIKMILKNYDIKSLKEAGINVEVEEDQDSFVGNATKKAKEIFEIAKEPVIADDSGICIETLNNEPGVKTARFLGPDATARDRNKNILKRMQGAENRVVRFICNLVYYDGKNTIVGEGVLKGNIAQECRGDNGFGFDEIFELEDGRTLAEMSQEEKNELSARYLATLDLREKLKKIN